jgi:hypothetical protein
VANLPPNNNARVQVDLYNHKLNNIDDENVHPIKIKFLGAKLDLVGYDGFTPNQKCVSLYEEGLQIPTPTSVKSTASTPCTSKSDLKISTIMPVKSEMIGRIIGKNGTVIKRITTDCDVTMTFGTWKVRGGESRDDDPESYTAVLINGLVNCVERAMKQVSEIIKPRFK